jgi:hypothetical protein
MFFLSVAIFSATRISSGGLAPTSQNVLLFIHTVSSERVVMDMHTIERAAAIATWKVLLNDSIALLENPGAQHKALLRTAHSLHRSQVIDRDDLSDMLELADGALEYAVEAQLDQQIPEGV